jgi:hopanoid biosynthesis associated radical SAM protein HpnJ
MIEDSRLIDASANGMDREAVIEQARGYDLVIIHISTPTFASDISLAEELKKHYSGLTIGLVGPHATVLAEESLLRSKAVDFVAVGEFDETVTEISRGVPFKEVEGIVFRSNGSTQRTARRRLVENLDSLPFVTRIYARDLTIKNYYIGYLQHPYISLYTGRGCRAHCTFCLWPQTIGGGVYRVRSAENIYEEMAEAKSLFPKVKEFFFDDDTFTDNPQLLDIARKIGRLGITWSCNARANVPRETLKVLKENGLRLLTVGFESGNQQILNNVKKGIRIEGARQFALAAKEVGVLLHATFILGLPGETKETMEQTMRFAQEIDPYSMQVSLAAPYPGTQLYEQAKREGWMVGEGDSLTRSGIQESVISYPSLSKEEMFEAVERFYRRFYLRPRPILRILADMLKDKDEFVRRIREGREFFSFMAKRKGRIE